MSKTVKQVAMQNAKKHPNQWKVTKKNFSFSMSKPTHKYAIVSIDGSIFVMSKRTVKNDGFVKKGKVNLQTKSFWDWVMKKEGVCLTCKVVKLK